MKYVLIADHEGELFCMGIFDDFRSAVGEAYIDIAEFSDSYKEDGDLFEIGPCLYSDNDSGFNIKVKFKSHCWSHSCTHWYHILTWDDHENERADQHE